MTDGTVFEIGPDDLPVPIIDLSSPRGLEAQRAAIALVTAMLEATGGDAPGAQLVGELVGELTGELTGEVLQGTWRLETRDDLAQFMVHIATEMGYLLAALARTGAVGLKAAASAAATFGGVVASAGLTPEEAKREAMVFCTAELLLQQIVASGMVG